MPELPEVETVVRGLREPLIGHTIQSMWYDWENSLASPPPDEFASRVVGQKVIGITRRAKYIVIELDTDFLLVHLRMTGRLYVSAQDATQEADKWLHVKFALDQNRELRFSDSRKFGKVYLAARPEEITGHLGLEPLENDFTPEIFYAGLQVHSKMIKTLLLDQTFIAGIGNIYADEALHRAGIHPERLSKHISLAESQCLYGTIRTVLSDGINYEGASINWYRKPDGTTGKSQNHFYVYGRAGELCKTCETSMIEKIRVAQRGTHFCPTCQAKG